MEQILQNDANTAKGRQRGREEGQVLNRIVSDEGEYVKEVMVEEASTVGGPNNRFHRSVAARRPVTRIVSHFPPKQLSRDNQQ